VKPSYILKVTYPIAAVMAKIHTLAVAMKSPMSMVLAVCDSSSALPGQGSDEAIVIPRKGPLNPIVTSSVQLLSYLLLLIGNVTYLSDHLLEAGIIAVLALQGANLCPLCLPGHLLVERKIYWETVWNSSGWDQYSW
jgi:hypothetical protein